MITRWLLGEERRVQVSTALTPRLVRFNAQRAHESQTRFTLGSNLAEEAGVEPARHVDAPQRL